jgi:hypothetical protein
MALLTHDEIRTASIATLQADASLNAAVKTWLRYLIDTGKIVYPAIYIGEIKQPLDGGSCGSDTQSTDLENPMQITVGVLSNTHVAAAAELGTLYELTFNKFKAVPELGLSNFKIHHISPITTNPIPKLGRSIIQAKMILNATWEE